MPLILYSTFFLTNEMLINIRVHLSKLRCLNATFQDVLTSFLKMVYQTKKDFLIKEYSLDSRVKFHHTSCREEYST
ncbi:MAG: hypothetical protein Kow0049_17170 [Stanieria sp.]